MSSVVRIDPGPRMSEASVFGDRMYLSGMIPEDTSLDVTGQVTRYRIGFRTEDGRVLPHVDKRAPDSLAQK